MLVERGRIMALEAGYLWVETIRKTTCGDCSLRKGCGHGLLSELGSGRENLVRVLPGDCDTSQLKLHDEVEISIPESLLIKGSLTVYVIPLLLLLAGTALASRFSPGSDAASMLGAVAGFALGVGLVYWHGLRHRDDQSFQPTLIGVPAGHVSSSVEHTRTSPNLL